MKKGIVHLIALGIAIAVITGNVVYCGEGSASTTGVKFDARQCRLKPAEGTWRNDNRIHYHDGLGNNACGCVCAGSTLRSHGTRRMNGDIPRYENPVACNTVQSGYLSLVAFTGHHLGCTTKHIVAEETVSRGSQPSILRWLGFLFGDKP